MLLVLAMSTVRSIRGFPDFGSSSSGNSVSTSVISFPRSPHPMYTTISASLHFASCCWVTVLPLPKGPGIAAVPPLAIGKSPSRIRCPVIRGTVGFIFSFTGLGTRTGHFCISEIWAPLSRVHTTSSTVKDPALMLLTVPPFTFGGTMIRWTMFVSWTSPMMLPGATLAPSFTSGLNSHFFA